LPKKVILGIDEDFFQELKWLDIERQQQIRIVMTRAGGVFVPPWL
jgi:hypothetical protein